jgi:hypothetical protein
MPERPAASITHFTPRRLRIRVPEKKRDRAFFDHVAERLSDWDSVERVETNPLTASILIHFTNPNALLFDAIAKNDLLEIDFAAAFTDATVPVAIEAAVASFDATDRVLRRWTQNQIDVRSVVFLLLLAGGVFQVLRRRLDTPAPTLLWYAGELIGVWKDRRADSASSAPLEPVYGAPG